MNTYTLQVCRVLADEARMLEAMRTEQDGVEAEFQCKQVSFYQLEGTLLLTHYLQHAWHRNASRPGSRHRLVLAACCARELQLCCPACMHGISDSRALLCRFKRNASVFGLSELLETKGFYSANQCLVCKPF